MRAWLGVFVCTACSLTPVPFPMGDDIAEIPDARPDSTLPFEAGTFDATGTDATPFNGGGPFTCVNCTCDGTLNYCVELSGGAPIVDSGTDAMDDGGLSACDPEASACMPIPIDCLPKPTCDCVLQKYKSCKCDVDPSGNGLVVSCNGL
jgi:hypothetical protein